ncbi:beta-hydroxyaspartate dehydratase BhcB [Rhabdochromatium marinum]|uniref:beta-hydroxyaspartate dehydratase BhcB n=1 Tax=Rhabdochromatium marinum TaxID=48729 RepID=UPI0019034BF1|nr:beta-hydroxyaspartate dehydratase BhcB [Rhabdochromatium marinum]MBK1649360.1 serine dehydratase [Rhabdochromatium marinum]
MHLPDYNDVCRAHERITPWIHRTPILTSTTFDAMTGARLFFKCENFQKTGAFKSRGAVNAVFGLEEADAPKGVATHSSGNHGMALARAAACRGIDCTVVMPETAPRAKMDAVRGYGGQVVLCAPRNTARQQTLDAIVAESGANVVPPYDDARVIAGQGTCAKELLEDVEDLDIVIAPIGGGGLISGTALSARALSPATQVFAAEPANADDAYRSLQAGQRIIEDAPDTIADGLKASLGELNWGIVAREVDTILLAQEDAIIKAMRLIWQRMKIIVEPSCAVPLATILHHPEHFADQRVGVILTGGNVNLERLPWL